MPVIQMLIGGAAPARVQVISGYIIANGATALASRALVEFNIDGTQYRQEGAAAKASMGIWLKTGAVADYEIRATLVSGDPPSVLNTWLALSTSRSWSLNPTASTQLVGTILVEIRDAATGTILDSAQITLDATRS